ncbi:MAG: hypothetical protein PUC21_10155 [Bacteroidales bacterium]|nr:hypothetical protein [Bacteroidales bacterium]
MNEVGGVVQIADSISNFGIMIVICAVFIVLSILMWVAIFKWFKSIIDNMMKNNAKVMNELLKNTEAQNELLNDIADGMRPSTLLQIKNISNTCFDLSAERVCRIIKKVKTENNIINKEATKAKIRTLLCNLHEDRNSRFDNHRYRGKTLTQYTAPEWIDWVSEVVESEVYSETVNDSRTFTNVEAVYSRIKIDFYHRLTE